MNATLSAVPETRRHVWTGQLDTGRGHTVLTALLGSCVGIGMLWRRRGVVGLAHCLLPEGAPDDAGHGGRHVSNAVPGLLAAMGVRREHYGEIEVVIAGGARMLRLAGGDGAIGRRNVLAAHAHLAARGLSFAFEDVGGCHGRRLTLDCARQRFSVEQVAKAHAPDAQPAAARTTDARLADARANAARAREAARDVLQRAARNAERLIVPAPLFMPAPASQVRFAAGGRP